MKPQRSIFLGVPDELNLRNFSPQLVNAIWLVVRNSSFLHNAAFDMWEVLMDAYKRAKGFISKATLPESLPEDLSKHLPKGKKAYKDLLLIAQYCIESPESAFSRANLSKIEQGDQEYWQAFVTAFYKGREASKPKKTSTTVPDPMVSLVLQEYFDVPSEKLDTIKLEHKKSMSAENFVGSLLERYLVTVLEPLGWVWCSGSVVKSIDFLKKKDKNWILLQVKNRDNSENSSSKKVRDNTSILKWHRSVSKTGKTLWDKFPDKAAHKKLNEKGFEKFVKAYLK